MSQQSSQASGEGLSLPGNLGNLSLRQEAPRSDSAGSTGVPGWTNGDYKPPNEPLAAWYDETDDVHVQDQLGNGDLVSSPVGLFYIPGCYQQDHSAAALVPLDFMRKITGYEKYSEHIHAVNWGVEGHQNLRMLLRQMQRWGLLPAKYSPSLLHSSPSEKECPKVFDLRKPKYKPRTGQPIPREQTGRSFLDYYIDSYCSGAVFACSSTVKVGGQVRDLAEPAFVSPDGVEYCWVFAYEGNGDLLLVP